MFIDKPLQRVWEPSEEIATEGWLVGAHTTFIEVIPTCQIVIWAYHCAAY